MTRLRYVHEEKRTWDSGNPEAVDGWVSWCGGCGQRPWPCDTARALAALNDVLDAVDALDDAEGHNWGPAPSPMGNLVDVARLVRALR